MSCCPDKQESSPGLTAQEGGEEKSSGWRGSEAAAQDSGLEDSLLVGQSFRELGAILSHLLSGRGLKEMSCLATSVFCDPLGEVFWDFPFLSPADLLRYLSGSSWE